jgi:hypothetical protein
MASMGYTLPSTSLLLSKPATANAANFFPTPDLLGRTVAGYQSRRVYVLARGQVRSFKGEAFKLFASQNPESGIGKPVSNLFCVLEKVLENIVSFGEKFVEDKGRFFRLERIQGLNASAPVLLLQRIGVRCASCCSMVAMRFSRPSSSQRYLPEPVVMPVGKEGQLDLLQDDCWKNDYVPQILTPGATPYILHRSW